MGSGITPTGGNGHARTDTTSGDYSIRRPTEAYWLLPTHIITPHTSRANMVPMIGFM